MRNALPGILMLLFAATAVADDPAASSPMRRRLTRFRGWTVPLCAETSGHPAVVTAKDGGATLLPRQNQLSGVGYTYGLVALRQQNTLIAMYNHLILRSTDAGCSWTEIGAVEQGTFPPNLVAAKDDRVYGWSPNRSTLFVITGSSATPLISPVDSIAGLGVDATDPRFLRIASSAGAIWESRDGGIAWTFRGGLRVEPSLIYEIVFDPRNLDHAVAGTLVNGGFVTTDGGLNWVRSTGLSSAERGSVNLFRIAFSPVDSQVVWAMGLDLARENDSSRGRYLFRSTDGGASFASVFGATAEVTLVNGPTMAAHPREPSVLYFVFGTFFQGYGTDLFVLNVSTGALTKYHHQLDDVNRIVFHPADPSVIYLGAEVQQIN